MATNPQTTGPQPLRPALAGSAVPAQNFAPPMHMQFRPMMPNPQGHQFVPGPPQQFRPVAQGMPGQSIAMPSGQIPHFPQAPQQMPPRPGPPGQAAPSPQSVPIAYVQQNRSITPGSLPLQQSAQVPPNLPNLGGAGMPLSSSYTFSTSYGQPSNNMNAPSQYQHPSQMQTPITPSLAQTWPPPPTQSVPTQQPSVSSAAATTIALQSTSTEQISSDWQEHTAADGKRYFYNKKTRQSVWEKPLDLMTPIERADASTVWKEFTTADGRKYYYNKLTKQSKWTVPDELKLAREEAEKAAAQPVVAEPSGAPVTSTLPSAEMPSSNAVASPVVSNAVPVPVTSAAPPVTVTAQAPSAISSATSLGAESTPGVLNVQASGTPAPVPVCSIGSVPSVMVDSAVNATMSIHENASVPDGASAKDLEEAIKTMPVTGKVNVTPLEEKTVEEEPFVYATKLEAKNAFKALLESCNVESDWTWDQAMRVIINDKRYGALRTLGERKQAFNEYLGQRKKQDAEERRIKQKKAREDFIKMLEGCNELTSSTKWSKARTMFEDDERFNGVDRPREREDLYENYMLDLQKKEKAKAAEDHKKNIQEYRAFLESCDSIKVNTQWRKVQDLLEDDERCSRLEKIDRLEIFQEYIRDLEKEEEEQKKIQKEQQRREERKNRDEFRKLMEGHAAGGILTAKTHWRDYCMQVKDLPAYKAVAANTSGSTPKDLFEDVAEELEKQYQEDRSQIKDALKIEKITLLSSWTFEDFKAAVSGDDSLKEISEINSKLVFEELLERIREKEEKEARKRQKLADNFSDFLHSIKEITVSSSWEDCKLLFEESQEYRLIDDESLGKEIFEAYVAHLQEKLKEKERKREEEKTKKEKEREEKEKRKEKERKEKERDREKEKAKDNHSSKDRKRDKDETESENVDVLENHGSKDRKRDKDKERKHRKRHHSTVDDLSSDKDEKEESKKPRRHSSDRKKSRKHSYASDSDSDSRHKRHKRDRDGSRRNGGHEELEDGELGEDGEIR